MPKRAGEAARNSQSDTGSLQVLAALNKALTVIPSGATFNIIGGFLQLQTRSACCEQPALFGSRGPSNPEIRARPRLGM